MQGGVKLSGEHTKFVLNIQDHNMPFHKRYRIDRRRRVELTSYFFPLSPVVVNNIPVD